MIVVSNVCTAPQFLHNASNCTKGTCRPGACTAAAMLIYLDSSPLVWLAHTHRSICSALAAER